MLCVSCHVCNGSGYQSVIMAPTQILAAQHYEKLKEAAEPFGYKVVFLSSGLKKKEKKSAYEGISTGEYTFIVGTHSVLSPDIQYKNLALAVIDEEHRFGVASFWCETEGSTDYYGKPA